jgi:hypothetical protein
MKKIFISGAHGSACSLVKSLAIGNVQIDDKFATCHESWTINKTQNQQNICFNHTFDRKIIQKNWNPDIAIWIKIADENITLICRRIVILDFVYTDDPQWVQNDWCWTTQKHQRLAGPDWPPYSKNIFDYPSWCLDEMCYVAWERSRPWMTDREDFDYTISSDELFGNSPRTGLVDCFLDLGLKIDHDAIDNWKQKNSELLKPFMEMFSWTPQWQPPQEWVTLPIDKIK